MAGIVWPNLFVQTMVPPRRPKGMLPYYRIPIMVTPRRQWCSHMDLSSHKEASIM